MKYILTEKQLLNLVKESINEVSSVSNNIMGDKNINIPKDDAHKGQKGWQSNNAWDIATPIDSPVYAVAGGTLLTYNDYGPKPIHRKGKTLFGVGFTVDSNDGLPDVYYTHLKDCTVRKGDTIECGQLLGYVMDFPDSSYDHLHIGVESGHNIREFIGPDGTLKCAKGMDLEKIKMGTINKSTEKDVDDEDNIFSSLGLNINDIVKKSLGL